jgi:uncharacterized RDD family membrane protein YckC
MDQHPAAPAESPSARPPADETPALLPVRDAGFWLRAAAAIIDHAIVLPALFAAGFALAVALSGWQGVEPAANGAAAALLAALWLYHALFECSGGQATLGKRTMGLQVVDRLGRRITFLRASGRYFAKALSAVPLFGGFALVGLSRRKQGLHDLIASTRVVTARSGGARLGAAIVVVACGLTALLLGAAIDQVEQAGFRQKTVVAQERLRALARAEEALFERTGAYASFAAPASGRPGKGRRAWSQAELDGAAAIGWEAPEARETSFSYRLIVERTDAGNQSWSACAEGDLDGDGVVQAIIVFQPAVDAQGTQVAPPAPCAYAPRLERPLSYQGEVGPFRASPAGVF